jgi:competence protein ComEA
MVLVAAVPLAWRAVAMHVARPPERRPVAPCRAIEVRGVGVGCVVGELPSQLRAGDLLDARGRRLGRMAPARLEAWQAPVDVNRSSIDELASLPGIGPKLAAQIAAARPFSTVDEVVRVRGIGPKTLARIRNRLDVLPSTGSTR